MAKTSAIDSGFITSAPVSKTGMQTQLDRAKSDIEAIGGSVSWWGGLTTGGATAYAVTVGIGSGSVTLTSGLRVAARLHITCGASPTLQFNSLTAKVIKRWDTVTNALVNIAAGDLLVGETIDVVYNSTDDCWVMAYQPAEVSAAYVDALANRAAAVISTTDVTLTAATISAPQVFNITVARTLNLPALSSVAVGRVVKVRNADTSTATLTIDPNSTETVNGATTFLVFPGESLELVATATDWLVFGIAPPSWRRVLTQTASSSAQIDFVLPSGFNDFRIEIAGMRPATDNVQPLMRTSTDGGSTFDAGATDYTGFGIVVTTGVGGAPANASSGILAGAIDTGAATEHSLATIDFYPGNGTLRPLANVVFSFPSNGTTAMEQQIRSFRRNSATTANAIRFLMSSGNIAEGRFTLLARRT